MQPEERKRIRLPEVMDLRAAKPLAQTMRAARGAPLTLEAQDVRRLGGLCLQVLLSARLTWAADKLDIIIEAPSQAFQEAAALFGATSLGYAPAQGSGQ